MEVVDTIKINLKDTIVELDMSSQFINTIRKTFNLTSTDIITENHVKHFLIGSMKKALEEDGTNVST